LHLLKVHGALLAVAFIYGANYSIAKSLMPDFIGPNGFILLRIIGGFVLFFAVQGIWVREKIKSLSDYGLLALCALLGVATNMLFFFNGLSLTSPINASVIMTINPLMVMLFSLLFLNEGLNRIKILGIAIGMTGAVAQIMDPFGVGNKIESVNWQGDLYVLINAASYALYLVLVKPLMQRYHPLTVVKWTFTFGFLMVLPFGWSEVYEAEWQSLDLSIGWRLAFVILATTFMVYLLNAWALKYVKSSVVGSYIYLQPLFASTIAILWAGYEFSAYMLIYAALIFVGVYLVSFTKSKKSAHG